MPQIGKFNTIEYISNKCLLKATGLSDDDLNRPIIGIANSFNEMVPGHNNLRRVAECVKNGIYRAGGTPLEFGVVSCCDGVADGHDGAHYVLPSREVIADSVEIQAKAHSLDGIVLLASCDKTVPGMLMAAAGLIYRRFLCPAVVCRQHHPSPVKRKVTRHRYQKASVCIKLARLHMSNYNR